MSMEGGREQRILGACSQFFAVAAAVLGVVGFLGWAFARPLLSSFGAGLIPMAPSTAVLFLLLGVAVILSVRLPRSRVAHRAGVGIASLAIIAAVSLFLLSWRGIYLPIERLGFTAEGTVDGALTGHMSPVTAFLFACAGASFLLSLASSGQTRRALTALWPAVWVALASYILILAYLFGWPLLYGGKTIPPALPTSLAFAALGIALAAFARMRSGLKKPAADRQSVRLSYALLGVFAILALSIIASGYLYYKKSERQHRENVERQLSAIAELKARDLDQWRKERLGDGDVMYRNAAFYELVRRFFESPGDLQAREHIQAWMRKIQQSYHYDRILLLDPSGAERLSEPGAAEPVASHLRGDVASALEEKEVAFLDFRRDAEGQPVYLAVTVPILDEQDGSPPLGVLALRIDPEQYIYPMISRWPVPSATAETLLVRREGNEVVFLNNLRFQKDSALTLRRPLGAVELPAVKAVRGEKGVATGVDYRGVPVLAAVHAVPDSPWYLVARMDLEEVYAPMWERLGETILFVAIMLLCVATGMTLVWWQQRTRFYRQRYEAERERAWLQDVISRSLNEVYVFDPDTLRFSFVNAGACRNMGYTLDELARLTPLDINPNFTESAFRTMIQPLLTGERELLVFETVQRRKDGSSYPIEVHLQYVKTAGEPVFLSIINDITERKRAERAIRRLNRVYAVLSDINQAIVRTRDTQELFEKSCQIAIEKGEFPLVWIGLVDQSRGELRPVAFAGEFGDYLEKVRISLTDEPRLDCPIDTALRGGKPVINNRIEEGAGLAPCQKNALRFGFQSCASFPLRVADEVRGAITFYAIEEHFFDDEELKLLDELSMDLSFAMKFAETESERQRAKGALQHSVERYRHLVDLSPMAIFVNRGGRIDYINPAGLALFGAATPDQIIGKSPFDLFHADYHNVVRERIHQLTQERKAVPLIEEKIVRLDGATRDVEVAASPFTDHEGEAIQVILNDITNRKNLEAQLNHARKMEAVGQLAGGVAHDFNNILQAIMGCTQLLADSPQATEQQRELLAEIHSSAQRAATLTRQLLAFSRRQVMQPEVLDLNRTIEDFLKMLRRVIGEHIRLDFLPGSHLGSVYADRSMMEQVIMNLCVNARDAMPGGGVLAIETENVRIDPEYCGTHVWAKPGRYILLSVTDTGCGMDAATIEHVFEPFFTTKPEGKGTGLGLSTVYGIVKQHDGMISAYSEPGKGTTFKIYLPLCERDAETIGSKIEGLATGGSETILLAEDDEAVRRLAERILERAGYRVLTAASGDEAVALFKRNAGRIDLLLFDVVMPGMGGHEAYEQIHGLRPDVPVLFSSGYSENAVHTNFVLHNGLALIQKPYARDELLRAVRRALTPKQA